MVDCVEPPLSVFDSADGMLCAENGCVETGMFVLATMASAETTSSKVANAGLACPHALRDVRVPSEHYLTVRRGSFSLY